MSACHRRALALMNGVTFGLLALSTGATALAQGSEATAYRCGNSYSAKPCPGGTAVNADDSRSQTQQSQAQQTSQREAALADQLAAERRARENAAAAQAPARIGPAAAVPVAGAASKSKHSPGKKKIVVRKPKKAKQAAADAR